MGEVAAQRPEWVDGGAFSRKFIANHPLSRRALRADSSPIKGEEEGGGGEHDVYLVPTCAYENLAQVCHFNAT